MLENSQKFFRCLLDQANLNKTVSRIGFKLHCYILELDRHKKAKNFYELLDWPIKPLLPKVRIYAYAYKKRISVNADMHIYAG